jgi:predicted thioesterase
MMNESPADSAPAEMPAARLVRVVGSADTAVAVGSGTVSVLGTPVLVAWLEAATLQVAQPPAGMVSVGTRVAVTHLAASDVGAEVECTAVLTSHQGSRQTFAVSASHTADGQSIAQGTISRALVDRQRFLGE